MSRKNYKSLLGFTEQWFALGILTEEALQRYGATYETGVDKNAEHYRYGAFRWYLKAHRPVSETVAEALYDLGASDPDRAMGEAIMADIVELPECPASVSAKALSSGRKHLIRTAERRRLLSELRTSPITPEVFSRAVESRDSALQRVMVEAVNLPQEQMRLLAEQGASRAVRNMASGRLRQRTKKSNPR
jgi:hypothetical protein